MKNCSSQILNACPINSRCSEISAELWNGRCTCDPIRYTFNPKYIDAKDYCIQKKDENIANETHKSDKDDDSANPSDGSTHPPPGVHHIAAGILIPIVLVFVVIGAVFVYKKLHITHRVRNMRRTRRNHTPYEDVMLGNNDNDDPPLI